MKLLQQEAAKRHFRILRPALLAYIEPFGVYSYGVQSSLDTRANNPDTGLYLDGNTGEMRHLFLPDAVPIGNRFTNLINGLHFGDFRAWQAYRLLEFVTGLLICLLSITGIYIWWKKRKVRSMASNHPRLSPRRRMFEQLPLQRAPMNAQQSRGLRNVAIAIRDHALHVLPLDAR